MIIPQRLDEKILDIKMVKDDMVLEMNQVMGKVEGQVEKVILHSN